VLREKEELLDTINKMRMDYSSTSEKCEDLSNINEHLKQKIQELEKEKDELKVIQLLLNVFIINIYN